MPKTFIEQITEVIDATQPDDLDSSFVVPLDMRKGAMLPDLPIYRSLMLAFKTLGEQKTLWGGVKFTHEEALAGILRAHADVIRGSITRRIRLFLLGMGADALYALNAISQTKDLEERLEKLKRDVDAFEAGFQETAKDKPAAEFKAYLMYAADRWGNADEKKAVAGLVGKIKNPRRSRKLQVQS